MSKEKRCLIVSYGPVPTPDNQTVEGGGMRAWGLAQGLLANGIDVTVGVNAGFPQRLSKYEGVTLINWSLDAEFARLINSFDAVVVSYCMGDPSVFVADHIATNVQLILDCYVPIYIEVSARESKNISEEYVNYAADIARHNHVLKRGDYFLYANDTQEQLYKGVLSALGIINPLSYREVRLIKTPFGIHRTDAIAEHNPYEALGIRKTDFVVLWFGGLYPWFRIQEYLDTIKELSSEKNIKFVFVGGKNPFNPNPDFSRQYDNAVTFSDKYHFTNNLVHFVDWVDFDTRIDWFKHADVIVSLNQPGEENKYSWRTRVMDYVWGEAVTITNGGDPLSDELIENNAAIKMEDLSARSLVSALRLSKAKPGMLKEMRENVRGIKNKYYWDVVTNELGSLIRKGSLPYLAESTLRNQIDIPAAASIPTASRRLVKLGRMIKSPLKIARKIKQKGVRRSIKLAANIVKTQTNNRINPATREKQFVFISHPINNTGAPIVLLQIIEEFVEKYGANRVRVIAPGIEAEQEALLKKIGIKVEHALFGANFHFIRLQLGLRPDDFVLMNTVAVYDSYRDFILLWLKNRRLKHAYWFIHEDPAQLPVINPFFLHDDNIRRIQEAVNDRKLDLLFPSKRTCNEYKDLLGISSGKAIQLRVEVPGEFTGERTLKDFDTLRFLLSGTASDGRKGQLLALSAFQYYQDNYFAKNPENYRPFELHLVAVGEKDYVSQQIRWIASSTLSENVKIYDSLPKDKALEIAQQCNTVICCSLNETFGLYIAEGMLMGHVVLRNNCAGVDEQLIDGKNGYLINHTDIKDFAKKIEQLLNKRNMSSGRLLQMSLCSQEIITKYSKPKYIDQIDV